ncbi:MAG TPA: hypothetical protein VFS21_25530 [Roseiflexaceae bacterium]|nr:hypothetical protein [Roseiflexaceae bacterium]
MPQRSPLDLNMELLSDHWADLAAQAWSGYKHLGRGAIVIDHCTDAEPLIYYLDRQLARVGNGGWPWPDLENCLQEYDPRAELLCIILQAPDSIGIYKLGHPSLTPQQAYLRTQPTVAARAA